MLNDTLIYFANNISIAIYKVMQEDDKKYNIDIIPNQGKIFGIVLICLLSGSLFYFGRNMFIFVFLVFPVINYLLPSKQKRFLKYQSVLPTSKIRSVAIGLAEIEGRLLMIKPVITPIKKKECIGYRYKIESVSKDRYQKKTYEIIKDEINCNPFFVEDDTGEIEVNPINISFVWIPIDERYERRGKRYTQYVLYPNDKMLLVGKSSIKKNNKPVFEYEDLKKVFSISPASKISTYNFYKPLLNSFISFVFIFAFITALILITPIKIKENKIDIETPKIENPFK